MSFLSRLFRTAVEIASSLSESSSEQRADSAPPRAAAPAPHVDRRPAAPTERLRGAGRLGFAVVDLETTGLSPEADRIVDIAVIQTDVRGNVEHRWTTRVDPEGPVGATHIHGITQLDVQGMPRFGELVPTVAHLLAGRAIVAHNASFDVPFLKYEFGRAGWAWPEPEVLCTYEESRYFLPRLDRRKLPDCCDEFGIPLRGAHSAEGDAIATAALLRAYLDPSVGVAPARQHLELPHRAARVTWPAGPATGRDRSRVHVPTKTQADVRRFRSSTVRPPSGWIAAELTESDLLAAGCPKASLGYGVLVLQALEDREVTDAERSALGEAAAAAGLAPAARDAVHESIARAVADAAWRDGHLATKERDQVKQVLDALGLDAKASTRIVKEAEAARGRRLAEGCRPLPSGWRHGEPLRVGDRIVFSGCDDVERNLLEELARRRGLRVTTTVSSKTSALITDGTGGAAKSADAAKHGTRIVSPKVGRALIEHVQPPLA